MEFYNKFKREDKSIMRRATVMNDDDLIKQYRGS